jgi:hypothetical protein
MAKRVPSSSTGCAVPPLNSGVRRTTTASAVVVDEEEMNLKRAVTWCIALGVVSVFSLGVSHFALTDIYHGEGDLSLEWNILRGCFAVILTFQIYALVTLRRVARQLTT